MPNFNKVIVAGHLTRDCQLKYLPNQTAVAEGGIAVSRKYKVQGEDREEVCFIDFACFGKAGETLVQYTAKGAPILLEGRLKYESWDDKNGGGKRHKHTIVVDNFQFLGGKRDEGGGQGAPAMMSSLRTRERAPVSHTLPDDDGIDPESIPF